jgi:hypothetical protein
MTVHSESVGGTPACRMIHKESNQLFLGPYAIDASGNIRVISPEVMPGRLTAIARHLTDPENMLYYYDMEGMLYEVNVHTLAVNKLFHNPLPGWHGKGGYTSQGLLVVSNNGENLRFEKRKDWKVNLPKKINKKDAGILASWDGSTWKVIERHQFTDITGPGGIHGAPDDNSPLWAIGWDKRSLRLKLLDNGKWHTYLLPKAAHNNDPKHGWFTEWPRIREITGGKWMMDMHGMFYNFPKTFSAKNTAGISPISSHLRYIPDFCEWNGELVLATDETSIQGNHLAGQPQSNLWFGKYDDLKTWGPASGYGGPWIEDNVKASQPSDPYLIKGFARRILHLAINGTGATISMQIDKNGKGTWSDYKTITVPDNGYKTFIFPKNFDAEWIRLTADKDCVATAYFHYTDNNFHDPADSRKLFKGLADVNNSNNALPSYTYPAKRNRNLRVIAQDHKEEKYFDLSKDDFVFLKDSKDEKLKELIKPELIYSVDSASVIIKSKGKTYRLPKGNAKFTELNKAGILRSERELESERITGNYHGTFYDVPLYKVGQPPLYNLMRPVASHNKLITDFSTWTGLLVLSGINKNAKEDSHIIISDNNETALWLGGIDDLWKLGKPVGTGGPWKQTQVKADQPSDPYLMTGYDKKSMTITANKDATITLEVDFDHNSWHAYKTFDVKAENDLKYNFPEGFSAHWIRVISNADCIATVQLKYE